MCHFGFPWALGSGCCDLLEELLPLLQKEEGLWGAARYPASTDCMLRAVSPRLLWPGTTAMRPLWGRWLWQAGVGGHIFPDILSRCHSLGSVCVRKSMGLEHVKIFLKSLTILENRKEFIF